MTINKAIEKIKKDINDQGVDWDSPLGEAYKLSFEALKRERANRKGTFSILLPGETEEAHSSMG